MTPAFDDANAAVSAIGRLPEDSAVRHAAVRLLRGEPVDALPVAKGPLIHGAAQPWRTQLVAAWMLGRADMPPSDLDAAGGILMDVLESNKSDGAAAVLRRALGYSFASSFALILCISALIREVPPFPEEFLAVLTTLTAFLMLATGPVAWQVGRANRARVRAEAADSLGRLGYVEAVGPLAAALFDWDRNVRSAASAALHQLLPRLGSDQMGQFGAETMHHLGRALAHPDGELVAKALTALGEIGTSHALPYVERTVRSGRTGRIREAADRVRAILEERKHRETEVGRLLRPSSTSGDNAATLVRPARSVAEQELDLYLRPSAAEDSSTN